MHIYIHVYNIKCSFNFINKVIRRERVIRITLLHTYIVDISNVEKSKYLKKVHFPTT